MVKKCRLSAERLESRLTPSTIYLHQGGNLQKAIDAACPGDFIMLDSGATFTGPIILDAKTNPGQQWITIETNNFPVAGGTRVSPSNASSMAQILAPSYQAAIQTQPGASFYVLRGLNILPVNSGAAVDTLVTIGDGSSNQSSISRLPNNIQIDQCFIHGWDGQQIKRGVALNDGGAGSKTGVYDSYISNIKLSGQDSQAIGGWNGTGPYTIQNNYLEAAGENVMFGGAWSYIQQVPSNITIINNTLSKPLSWNPSERTFAGTVYTVKNLLELKNAQNLTIDHNTFQNNWAGAQDGHAIVLTPRGSQDGGSWATVSNVKFTHNLVQSTAQGFNILGSDDASTSQLATNLLIQDNVFSNVGGQVFTVQSGLSGGTHGLVIDHNTISPAYTDLVVSGVHYGFQFTNNLMPEGTYGMLVDGLGKGRAALAKAFPDGVITGNVIVGGSSSLYPAGNYFPSTWSQAQQLYPGAGASPGGPTPSTLNPIFDQTVPASQTVITVTLSGHGSDGDPLSYSATSQSLAYLRNQQAGGLTYHPEYDNFYGAHEKYLLTSNGTWYFIKSDGTFYQWDGSSGANGPNLGNIGTYYYTDPTRTPAAPANNPRATLSISGNTLTITRDSSFVSGMAITATVSDGHTTASQTFNVFVTAGTASTSTGLSSSVSPSVSGQSVTFTATVTATPPGTGTPPGTVTFKDGTTTLGTGTLNASGVATFTTSSLSVATHSVTAVYGGDANFTGSTSTIVSQVVNKAGTDVAITSSVNPSNVGQSVTFTGTATAHMPGTGTPTGTVTFKDGTTTLGTGTLNASGVATFTTSGLSAGNHTITASYGGDGNFNTGTSSALTQAVGAANTPPTLDPISDQTVPASQTVITVTLSGHDADGDTLSYSATGQSLAYLRNQQAGGLTYHPEYDNFYGMGEKWLLAPDNVTWYFIKSDGTFGRWDSSNGANGTNLGNIGRSYYTDPNQIAAAPANNPRATLSISGNTLTITRDPSFVSAMVITVTVNDGHGNTDTKTFTITVT